MRHPSAASHSPQASSAARLALATLALTLLASVAAPRGWAAGEALPAASPPPEDPYDRGAPRTAVLGYLVACREGDFERAAEYLDLRRLRADARAERGPGLARDLKAVLDQALWVDVEALSADPAGDPGDGLPAGRDLLGRIESQRGSVPVYLQRVPRGDGVRVWKISAETVERVPDLYDEFGYGEIAKLFPSSFQRVRLLEVQLWQWIALLALIVIAAALSWLAASLLLRLLRPLVRLSRSDVDDRLLALAIGPVRLALAIGFFAAGFRTLGLALPVQELLRGLTRGATVLALTWLLLRVVDMAAEVWREHLVRRGQAQAVPLLAPGRKTVKVVLVVIAGIALLDNVGFDVTALVAGLGVGGLAVALAAQKTLENLFGGFTLYADRPVRVGDFCRFGDRVGTVEEIGMRSTRVRTLDRTVVSVPNAEFSTLQLENFARRDKIWYHPTIGLRYETTPEQLRFVLVEIRKLLYSHPRVDADPARVRFTAFGAYSIDIEIFAYVLATDYSEFLAIAEDVNLRIMDVVEAAGTGFAFPSSTTYLARDEGVDSEKAREAEECVRAWRERGELHLPGFPPDVVASLRGRHAYPSEGSSQRGRNRSE